MQVSSHSNAAYREDIQGLRALAVLSVILFHVNKTWLPGGFIGVDIFLVLSGFLITSIILNEQASNTFSIREFFIKRIKRIVPAYLMLLIVVTFLMAILLIPKDYNFFEESLKSALYFSSNQYFSSFGNYFAPNSNELPLLHTWSLAVEMQFYFFLPFLLTLAPKKHLKAIFLLLIFLLLIYSSYEIYVNNNRREMYFSLLARTPEFLIGSWLAITEFWKKWNVTKSNVLSVIGLSLIAVSILFIDESTAFPGIVVIPACIGAALIIAAQDSYINKLFSRPTLVRIGNLSYSLYLWHWPILAGIRYYSGEYELDWISIGFFFMLTLIFSYMSYRFIELGFASKFQRRRTLYAITGMLTFTIFTTLSSKFINNNIVSPLAFNLTRYALPDEVCHGKIVGDCVRGNRNVVPHVLVIGDSHAAQLNLFFDIIGNASNQSFKVVTASSCVTIPGFDAERLPKWARQPCLDQINFVQELLPNYKMIIIAGMWHYHADSQKFMDALDVFLAETQKSDVDVIILAQIPMIKSNPVRLHRFDSLNLPTRTSLDEGWINSNQKVRGAVEGYPNTIFVDFSDSPFFDKVPFYKNELIYQDASHLNEVGSVNYANFVSSKLLSLLHRQSVINKS
ncbi:TPA: acyltransferase family protein [Vibrio cholerae]